MPKVGQKTGADANVFVSLNHDGQNKQDLYEKKSSQVISHNGKAAQILIFDKNLWNIGKAADPGQYAEGEEKFGVFESIAKQELYRTHKK